MVKHAQANPSTAQTNTSLVAAKANAFISLRGVFISSDTAMTVTIVNSETHDVVWRQYVGATGGSYCESIYGLSQSKYGEGFDYSTSTSGNVFLSVSYEYSR